MSFLRVGFCVQMCPSPRDLMAEALLKSEGTEKGKMAVHRKPGHFGRSASNTVGWAWNPGCECDVRRASAARIRLADPFTFAHGDIWLADSVFVVEANENRPFNARCWCHSNESNGYTYLASPLFAESPDLTCCALFGLSQGLFFGLIRSAVGFGGSADPSTRTIAVADPAIAIGRRWESRNIVPGSPRNTNLNSPLASREGVNTNVVR